MQIGIAPLATLRARRICIIKPSALGDIVQSLPVIHAIRQRFASAHIAWIINDGYESLIAPTGLVDELIPFHRASYRLWGGGGRGQVLQFLSSLKQRGFDVAIDLQGLFRSGAMAMATRAPTRIGLHSAREGASFAYTTIADDRPRDQPGVDRYWSVARLLGVGHLPREYPIRLSDAERRWAKGKLSPLPAPRIAVHVGARWETKRWPAKNFARAISQALPANQGSLVLVGDQQDRLILDSERIAWDRPLLNLAGGTTLRQLAAVLESVDLLVSNDSGPMHLAAAVGTATVGVYTCTTRQRSGPVDSSKGQPGAPCHHFIETSVPCAGSYRKTCSTLECMNQLSSDHLLPILQASLPIESRPDQPAGRPRVAG